MSVVRGAYGPAAELIQSAQTVTSDWVNLGLLIDTRGFNTAAAWLNININDSTMLRLRCLARHTPDVVDDFVLPIRNVSAGDVKLQDEFFEFSDDIDQKMIVSCTMENVIPHCQFQVMAGSVGATAAIITTAHYSTGY